MTESASDARPYFHGHGGECGEHRTVGTHRAWCYQCTEWCYPDHQDDESFESRCMGCRIKGLLTVIDAAKREVDEFCDLQARLGDLLAGTAAALKGAPAPLTMHSWHDLPEVAQRVYDRMVWLEQRYTTAMATCDAAATGEYATTGRQYGQGMAYLEKLMRTALTGTDAERHQ